MKIFCVFFLIIHLIIQIESKYIKPQHKKLERNLVSVPGKSKGDGVTKEIPGTKISITPPPKTLKDIPPKPIIVQPLYVKP